MDAFEVKNERDDEKQGIDFAFVHGPVELRHKAFHKLWRRHRRDRLEADYLPTISKDLQNRVVFRFPLAARFSGESIHLLMPASNQVGRQTEPAVICMDRRQYVSVTRHLLLRAILGRNLLRDQSF